jgi:hypothetical protein
MYYDGEKEDLVIFTDVLIIRPPEYGKVVFGMLPGCESAFTYVCPYEHVQILFILDIYKYINRRSLLGQYEHSTSKEGPFKEVKNYDFFENGWDNFGYI